MWEFLKQLLHAKPSSPDPLSQDHHKNTVENRSYHRAIKDSLSPELKERIYKGAFDSVPSDDPGMDRATESGPDTNERNHNALMERRWYSQGLEPAHSVPHKGSEKKEPKKQEKKERKGKEDDDERSEAAFDTFTGKKK